MFCCELSMHCMLTDHIFKYSRIDFSIHVLYSLTRTGKVQGRYLGGGALSHQLITLLGTFSKAYSQATTSQGYFPKGKNPKCAISHAATSQVCPYTILGTALGPYPILTAPFGPYSSLWRLKGPNLTT